MIGTSPQIGSNLEYVCRYQFNWRQWNWYLQEKGHTTRRLSYVDNAVQIIDMHQQNMFYLIKLCFTNVKNVR